MKNNKVLKPQIVKGPPSRSQTTAAESYPSAAAQAWFFPPATPPNPHGKPPISEHGRYAPLKRNFKWGPLSGGNNPSTRRKRCGTKTRPHRLRTRKAAVFLSLSVRQGLADALRGGAWLLSAHVVKQGKGCGLFFRWGCREFPLRRAAISREHPSPCAVCPFVLSAFLRCEAELREGFGLS